MQLTFKQLKNLPVYTKSNEFLGKVQEIEFSSSNQSISKYIVKSSQMAKRLAGRKILISPSQVVKLDEQKMVVEDSVVKNRDLVKEPAAV